MRFCWIILLLFLFDSCGPGETVAVTENKPDTVLILPEILSGLPLDTAMPYLRISAIRDTMKSVIGIVVTARNINDSTGDTVTVFADAGIRAWQIDSVMDAHCSRKDIRLAGTINGDTFCVPFHARHRFTRVDPERKMSQDVYIIFHLGDTGALVEERDSVMRKITDDNMHYLFRRFYGDAFNPDDSLGVPQRRGWMQTIPVLEREADAWDQYDKAQSNDTARDLASYNEFVNKLEIFQKVGAFSRVPIGLMEIREDSALSWGRLIMTLSVHRKAQQDLRESARQYLSAKIANEGLDAREFTDEDLLLLYPDRLKWHGRMSGPTEHFYDPYHLAARFIARLPEL